MDRLSGQKTVCDREKRSIDRRPRYGPTKTTNASFRYEVRSEDLCLFCYFGVNVA